jgi:hypothetical protein
LRFLGSACQKYYFLQKFVGAGLAKSLTPNSVTSTYDLWQYHTASLDFERQEQSLFCIICYRLNLELLQQGGERGRIPNPKSKIQNPKSKREDNPAC